MILYTNKKRALEVVSQDGSALEFCDHELQNDKDVVLVAVEDYPWSLQWVSKRLKNDKEVILTALKKDHTITRFVGEELLKEIKYNVSIQILEALILNEQLQKDLKVKKKNKKIKI